MEVFKVCAIENLKKQIENDIDNYICSIDAWQNVTRKRKKAGGDFQNLKQNFEGCSIVFESYNQIYLYVYYETEKNGYKKDFIDLKFYKNKAIEKGYNPEGRLQGSPYAEYIILNPDEIEKEIALHIEYRKEKLKEAWRALHNYDRAAAKFKKNITFAVNEAEEDLGEIYGWYLKNTIYTC